LYASLGSANWNDRSYLADRDSEMNIFFVKKPNTTEGFAKKLRKNLMKEHLGLDDQDD